MLEKLLSEIHAGGTLTLPILAERLGTSIPMVEMMVEQLQRMGLIKDFDSTCAQGCDSCSLGSQCKLATAKPRLWTA